MGEHCSADGSPEWSRQRREQYRGQVRGCLLGGALGDALGAPIEFSSLEQVREAHGPLGVIDLSVGNDRGLITDDTQMTLFTVEGLIRAENAVRHGGGDDNSALVHRAYLRWLETQQRTSPPPRPDGWLAGNAWLYHRRAPGHACLSGLRSPGRGTLRDPKNPNSKGCGAVMRSAPFGLIPYAEPRLAFDYAVECAVTTHGHPTGYLAAGAFAAIINQLGSGAHLRPAAEYTLELLRSYEAHQETSDALQRALAQRDEPRPETIERLGQGWVAEEALAMGVYSALAFPEASHIDRALLLSVNHSGDSDSTGSICGNLLGALHGDQALPDAWVSCLEGRDTLLQLADDFAAQFTASDTPVQVTVEGQWLHHYPGS